MWGVSRPVSGRLGGRATAGGGEENAGRTGGGYRGAEAGRGSKESALDEAEEGLLLGGIEDVLVELEALRPEEKRATEGREDIRCGRRFAWRTGCERQETGRRAAARAPPAQRPGNAPS